MDAMIEDRRIGEHSLELDFDREREAFAEAVVEKGRLRKRRNGDEPGTPLTRLSERIDVTDSERGEDQSRTQAEAEQAQAASEWRSEGPSQLKPEESPIAEFTPPLSRIATNLYTISYLIFFSLWGTLARLGLHTLTFYSGAPVTTGILWANVGGCVVMGFFTEDKKIFAQEWGNRSHENTTPKDFSANGQVAEKDNDTAPPSDPAGLLKTHKAVKKTIPLYIGITTGFCGSFTSFSTYMSDTFLAMSNDLKNPNSPNIIHRNDGYGVMSFLAVILYTVAMSLAALYFGAHFSQAITSFTPTIPFKFMRKVLDRLMIFLAFGCWLGAILLAIWPPDRHSQAEQFWRGRAVFALVFAPIGCLGRFYASMILNPIALTFPLGTFACNVFGSM
ncbi:hypothetical protein KEM54_001084, partial [Ascosphaera aggregata]